MPGMMDIYTWELIYLYTEHLFTEVKLNLEIHLTCIEFENKRTPPYHEEGTAGFPT